MGANQALPVGWLDLRLECFVLQINNIKKTPAPIPTLIPDYSKGSLTFHAIQF
jgi:hypothetical protein